jgi:CrcB protein
MGAFHQILWVGGGGFLGAVLRYLSSLLGQRLEAVTGFPSSVFIINLVGCLLIGLVNGIAESRGILTPQLRLLIVVGFLGSFTTFSTFGHDSFIMVREAAWLKMLFYTTGQVLLGVTLVWVGYLVAAR